MTGHPARQLARMAADAAGELRGYTDPADPFPWELTEDDHRAILPRLHHAIADLAVCIDGIAQATARRARETAARRRHRQAAERLRPPQRGNCHAQRSRRGAGRGAGHHDAACAAVGGRFPRRDDRRRAPGGHQPTAQTPGPAAAIPPARTRASARSRAVPRPGKRRGCQSCRHSTPMTPPAAA